MGSGPLSVRSTRPGSVTERPPAQVNLNKNEALREVTAAAEQVAADPKRDPTPVLKLLEKPLARFRPPEDPEALGDLRADGFQMDLDFATGSWVRTEFVPASANKEQEVAVAILPADQMCVGAQVTGTTDDKPIYDIYVSGEPEKVPGGQVSSEDLIHAHRESDGRIHVEARGAFSPYQDGSPAIFDEGAWKKADPR